MRARDRLDARQHIRRKSNALPIDLNENQKNQLTPTLRALGRGGQGLHCRGASDNTAGCDGRGTDRASHATGEGSGEGGHFFLVFGLLVGVFEREKGKAKERE